ncbi:MAG TPA: hypothetical protein VGM88_22830 [Kofleriaceae bacterium]
MAEPPRARYRREGDIPCIDVHLASVESLFDNRDPAPYRERDLDPDLAEYLQGAGDDLLGGPAPKIVFWLDVPCRHGEIEAAVHGFFAYEIERLDRRRRRARRIGQLYLLIGIVALVVLLSIAQVAAAALPASVGGTVREGLTLLSWIVLWRPVESLLFDGLPLRRSKRVMTRFVAAAIDVRATDSAAPSSVA